MYRRFFRFTIILFIIAILVFADVAAASAHPAEVTRWATGTGQVTRYQPNTPRITTCGGGIQVRDQIRPARLQAGQARAALQRAIGRRLEAGQTYVCHYWRWKEK